MIFIDPLFLFLFLPVTLIAFYLALLTRGRNEALLVIFTASIIFYAPYGISSVFLLLVALLVNFGVSNALLATDDSNPYRRVLYGCGQGYNIASLCYFKYMPIPMKPPLCSEMIAPPVSGMISPPV
ncbi:D-alanyl-lipoteichoic acid acyltransferase DltB (MBOAT superfamily) [Sinorhizobium meliloti]|nr:D-alanyl-lipoteichoic acid acyltransferase DltB (MBOAT superfamily) [Sinorhizobium meliloti]